MSAFYTPIFDRRWVKDKNEKVKQDQAKDEPEYLPVEDDNQENSE